MKTLKQWFRDQDLPLLQFSNQIDMNLTHKANYLMQLQIADAYASRWDMAAMSDRLSQSSDACMMGISDLIVNQTLSHKSKFEQWKAVTFSRFEMFVRILCPGMSKALLFWMCCTVHIHSGRLRQSLDSYETWCGFVAWYLLSLACLSGHFWMTGADWMINGLGKDVWTCTTRVGCLILSSIRGVVLAAVGPCWAKYLAGILSLSGSSHRTRLCSLLNILSPMPGISLVVALMYDEALSLLRPNIMDYLIIGNLMLAILSHFTWLQTTSTGKVARKAAR
jgi:hypothetical protein